MYKYIQKNIFSYLNNHFPTQISIVVWVSGWPDSMLLAYYIQQYYNHKWRDQALINIAHFNHWQRTESLQEHILLQKYFSTNTFCWNTEIPKPNLSETKLREKRHTFFSQVLEDVSSSTLLLGHNLSDRIETSLMNIVRGASTKWILWIKPYEKKKSHTILRPLITIDKKTIQEICDHYTIPYFLDPTNNEDITPRNTLRNTIIPHIQSLHTWWRKNRFVSWQELYDHLEKDEQKKNLSQNNTNNTLSNYLAILEELQPHPTRWVRKRYTIQANTVTKHTIHHLFENDTYMTKKKVATVYDFIHGSAKWYFYIWWWYIFKWEKTKHKESTLHILQWPNEFWKKTNKASKKITHTWLLQFDANIYSIQPDWIGYIIRYPQPWDTYKQKKLTKILLNKKIPVFMRHTIPVIASGSKILAILD